MNTINITESNTPVDTFAGLREIAFKTPVGSHRHVPHDEKENTICFTDGELRYQVECLDNKTLNFLNETAGLEFSLDWSVGSLFFERCMLS